MAGKKNEAAATVAQEPSTALVPATHNALAELLGDMDFDVTGLESVDNEDIKITSILFNMKGKDEAGKLRSLENFFNTTTEETPSKVRVAFVAFTKSNSWKKFDQAKNKSELICNSYDRVSGRLRQQHPMSGEPVGTERPCARCPDSQWRKDEKTGKNVQDCSLVYNVFGVLLDESNTPIEPFAIKFSRTSAPTWKTHLNKHHIGKNPKARGKDLPLFVYANELSLEVDDGGIFAVPAIKKGDVLRAEVVRELSEQAKRWLEGAQEYVRAAEKNEERHGGGDAIDTEGTSSPATTADDFADA